MQAMAKALKTSEIRFRQVVEASPNALLVIAQTGLIEMVNAQAEVLFGYPSGELLGLPVDMLTPERFRQQRAERRSAFLADPKPQPMGSAGSMIGLRKDGGEFPIEIGISPIETDEGVMVLSVIVDITERENRESALRLSEERFRSIVGAVSESIIIADADTGVFRGANPSAAQLYGYTQDEMVGLNVVAISAGDPAHAAEEGARRIAAATASGEPERFEWHCRAKDGRLFWADVSIRVAAIDGQRTVIATSRDLTERRATEEQLRQAQKMEAIGQLTGGIAHDFNNLLGIVVGNLDLLRSARPDDPELDELTGDALAAALEGAELTRSLLAFARRQPLKPQPTDLEDLISRTAKLLGRLLSQNIEVSLKFPEAPIQVLVDAAQLKSALTNLATNARDAMPRGGKLHIAARRVHLDAEYAVAQPDVTPGDYALIEVTDTGFGMAPKMLKHIFEPFYTTKGRDKGTGLGLSMVFGFVKQSGGHVSVYSEVGVGTTFRLYLPLALEAEAATTPKPSPELPKGQRELVLVVEDNPALRRSAVRQLGELGYRTQQASTAAEALGLLEANGFDLLFSDVVMPGGMDGLELAKAAIDRWPELKVVLTSGFPETNQKGDVRAANFPFLAKPYRKADLLQVMHDALDDQA